MSNSRILFSTSLVSNFRLLFMLQTGHCAGNTVTANKLLEYSVRWWVARIAGSIHKSRRKGEGKKRKEKKATHRWSCNLPALKTHMARKWQPRQVLPQKRQVVVLLWYSSTLWVSQRLILEKARSVCLGGSCLPFLATNVINPREMKRGDLDMFWIWQTRTFTAPNGLRLRGKSSHQE